MTDDIWRWSAVRIAGAIREREISAQEALLSCLERIAAVNPKLNAVTVDLSDAARPAARSADEAVARGDRLGRLHGVPVTIKENVDQVSVTGCPWAYSSSPRVFAKTLAWRAPRPSKRVRSDHAHRPDTVMRSQCHVCGCRAMSGASAYPLRYGRRFAIVLARLSVRAGFR